MKALPNDIVLRPRFQFELSTEQEMVLGKFENTEYKPLLIKRIDEHIFIKFDKEKNHFWSPQLHLEIIKVDEKTCKLYGIYGPNPTLWTFFMFLHFGVATVFVILGVWAYSSASLNRPYGLQLGLMFFMTILWFVLYAFGRLGKRKGKPQMHQLHQFVIQTLAIELGI